jgi:hypothetical protein
MRELAGKTDVAGLVRCHSNPDTMTMPPELTRTPWYIFSICFEIRVSEVWKWDSIVARSLSGGYSARNWLCVSQAGVFRKT